MFSLIPLALWAMWQPWMPTSLVWYDSLRLKTSFSGRVNVILCLIFFPFTIVAHYLQDSFVVGILYLFCMLFDKLHMYCMFYIHSGPLTLLCSMVIVGTSIASTVLMSSWPFNIPFVVFQVYVLILSCEFALVK